MFFIGWLLSLPFSGIAALVIPIVIDGPSWTSIGVLLVAITILSIHSPLAVGGVFPLCRHSSYINLDFVKWPITTVT